MSELLIQTIALFGFTAIGVIFLLEAKKWRSMGAVIGLGQRRLRIWLLALIEFLFLMMFIGPWVTGSERPLMDIIYWMLAIFLALAVVILALFDLRAVTRGYMSVNRQMFGDMRKDDRDEL